MALPYGKCPRCGAEVVSIGAYGDGKRKNLYDRLIAEGVPVESKFALEPCGDIIDATQIQLREIDGVVDIVFRRA